MSKRVFVAAIAVILGISAQARAFHPCGHYHYRSSGPLPAGVPVTGGVQTHGVSSFGVVGGVSSFGVVPGVSSFGVVPGVSSFGVAPGVSSFGVAPGVSSFGVMPGVSSFGVAPGVSPFGVLQNTAAGAVAPQGIPADILALLQNTCRVINPAGAGVGAGGGGANADDVAAKVTNALRKDIDAIKANQAIIVEDLKQLRTKQGIPRPETQPKVKENVMAPAEAPVVAAIDRNLADITALQKQLVEKEAKRAAARTQAPEGAGTTASR